MEDGGTAADAAAAMGFTLAVSLPSRAGLGGGGACLYFDEASLEAVSYSFLPTEPNVSGQPPRFFTGVPGTVRGLFALHTEHGRLAWSTVLVRAESMARFGAQVSRSLATDLAQSSATLVNDRAALDRFMTNRRQFLQEGESLRQLALSGLLARLRSGQVGSFYAGGIAQLMADQAQLAGGALTTADLNAYRVSVAAPSAAEDSRFSVDVAAGSEASTTIFVAADTYGNAASCVMTMGAPFGAGLMIEDFGVLLSVPPNDPGTHKLAIVRDGARGLSEVSTVFDGANSNSIECQDGILAEPSSCRMTMRSKTSGLAIQAGERR